MPLLIGARSRSRWGYNIVSQVPGLAVVGRMSPEAKSGQFIERLSDNPTILDSIYCPRSYRWLEALRYYRPDYALAPTVGAPEVWETLRPFCKEAQYICGREVVVPVFDPQLVEKVAQEGYAVAIYKTPTPLPPWVYTKAGARVWVVGGDPMEQWHRYAELSLMGVSVVAVILSHYWEGLAQVGYAYRGSPYRKVEVGRDDCRQAAIQSLEALCGFWEKVGRAVAGETLL